MNILSTTYVLSKRTWTQPSQREVSGRLQVYDLLGGSTNTMLHVVWAPMTTTELTILQAVLALLLFVMLFLVLEACFLFLAENIHRGSLMILREE